MLMGRRFDGGETGKINGYKIFVFCSKSTSVSACFQTCGDFHDFGEDIGLLEDDLG